MAIFAMIDYVKLTQTEIEELLGKEIGNINSWFCSDYIKETVNRLLYEVIVSRRAAGKINEILTAYERLNGPEVVACYAGGALADPDVNQFLK